MPLNFLTQFFNSFFIWFFNIFPNMIYKMIFNISVSILTLCRRFTSFFYFIFLIYVYLFWPCVADSLFSLKKFNWSLGYFSQKVNNFSYNKGFWIWLGESHDFFQFHGGFLMIFLISSNHTVKGTFEVRPTCTWVLEVCIYEWSFIRHQLWQFHTTYPHLAINY